MNFQLRTMGLPASGMTAFMPTPVENPASYRAGVTVVNAIMGNVPVGSPRPAALMDYTHPGVQPSAFAPNHFLPVVYVVRMLRSLGLNTRLPGAHHTPMPVPAVAYNQVLAAKNLKARIGGSTATPAVRPYISWPTYGGH